MPKLQCMKINNTLSQICIAYIVFYKKHILIVMYQYII